MYAGLMICPERDRLQIEPLPPVESTARSACQVADPFVYLVIYIVISKHLSENLIACNALLPAMPLAVRAPQESCRPSGITSRLIAIIALGNSENA
jgi:hypothetical protein